MPHCRTFLAAMFLNAASLAQPPQGETFHLLPAWLLSRAEPRWGVAAARFSANAHVLAGLPPVPHNQPTARLGYHGAYARGANVSKWLQVDLGEPVPFDAVALVPAEAAVDSSAGPGYGFPVRFRVESADDEHFSFPRLLADFTESDFPNPGTLPVFLECTGTTARFVRVTATRLWSRGDRWLFALGEIMVLRGPRNVAAGRSVHVSDGYDAAPTWQAANATDGYTALGPPVAQLPSATNGWHSAISRHPDVEKWVQVTLPDAVPIDEIRLYPAGPSDFPTRSGFGFPVRFRVETSPGPDAAAGELVFDSTSQDFINPGENPATFATSGRTVRSIRIAATRLWERTSDFIFALSEVEAWSKDRNVARGAEVTYSDATLRPQWQPAALVDGATSRWQLSDWSSWLRGLSRRRELETEQALLSAELDRLGRSATRRAIGWMLAAAGALGVCMALWIWRARRHRAIAAERLRERIAADLHDEIGSQLASIALLSQVAQRRRADSDATTLREIQQIAEETSGAMRDIVWLIRPSPGSVSDLVARIREVAARLLGDIRWEMSTDYLPETLPLDARRHVYLFAREALRNAAVHGRPQHVHVRFEGGHGALKLEIADDGAGLDLAATPHGTGLTSLQTRAAALKGSVSFESAPGKGTRVILVFPTP